VEDEPILRIAQLDPLYIEAIVPMTEFGSIQPGMRASIASEIDPDQKLSAEVVVVDGMGDAASGTFGIRLALPNPDYGIPAGVKCQLRLEDAKMAAEPNPAADPGLTMEIAPSGN
jgi:multidrug efflux pump subunit AcrA (membrane-fusion protein)